MGYFWFLQAFTFVADLYDINLEPLETPDLQKEPQIRYCLVRDARTPPCLHVLIEFDAIFQSPGLSLLCLSIFMSIISSWFESSIGKRPQEKVKSMGGAAGYYASGPPKLKRVQTISSSFVSYIISFNKISTFCEVIFLPLEKLPVLEIPQFQ